MVYYCFNHMIKYLYLCPFAIRVIDRMTEHELKVTISFTFGSKKAMLSPVQNFVATVSRPLQQMPKTMARSKQGNVEEPCVDLESTMVTITVVDVQASNQRGAAANQRALPLRDPWRPPTPSIGMCILDWHGIAAAARGMSGAWRLQPPLRRRSGWCCRLQWSARSPYKGTSCWPAGGTESAPTKISSGNPRGTGTISQLMVIFYPGES